MIAGFVSVSLLFGVLLAQPATGVAAVSTAAPAGTPTAGHLSRAFDTVTPQATKFAFLPVIMGPPPPTPTPTPTATPSQVLNPTCGWFPLGPSDRDDVECSPTNGLIIRRFNISHTIVACCGTNGARHYAISAEIAKTAGDGDYRIGFDVRSLLQGGGYLFGINPDTRSYSLYRVDDGDWKGGVPLIPWTSSDAILPGSQFNRMQVERRGADILLTINGQQVATVQDTTWLDQGIGWILYARNYTGAAEMQYERIRYVRWNDVTGQ